MNISEREFGRLKGESIKEYTLENNSGMTVSCLNYGCVITKVMVPDRHGKVENVVLGFDSFDDYLNRSPYFGAVVGRVAGRIEGARFELDGKVYRLADNESPNHLHGGTKGFSLLVWKAEKVEEENAVGIKFMLRSPDGDEGYPGNLEVSVTYLLNNDNELVISYEGKTDQKTIVNLTNHSYFNLAGHVNRDISEHILQLESDRFLELGPDLIPTGKTLDVSDTPFDFRHGKSLREGIHSTHPQNVLVGSGYDHPLVFTKNGENTITLRDEESGRMMLMTTDQPCVVVYSSNFLEGPYSIAGVPARNYLAVCLETQGFPDAIHHPEFPTIILNPDEVYTAATTYRFMSSGD